MGEQRHADGVEVDAPTVRGLLREQFPQWADLPLRAVEPAGTDHTIFRIGDDLVARLPCVARAQSQAEREARWVPFLAPQVPLELPEPVAIGEPGEGYPWRWSIVRWLHGEAAAEGNLDLDRAAVDLAGFVRALWACDATDGPPAGVETWGRGMPLAVLGDLLVPWIDKLDGHPLRDGAVAVLHQALDADAWDGPPTWFHGDLSYNLIAREGRLTGVIDSPYGVGDPACDLMPGWILFRGEARRRFFAEVGADDATVARARGWAVGPSIIGVSYYAAVPHLRAKAEQSIQGALAE